MIRETVPAKSAAWLADVESRLAPMGDTRRKDIIEGMRTHILDAVQAGEDEAEVLARLGTPETVAEFALEKTGDARGNSRRTLQYVGALLTLLAVAAIIFLPTYITVTTDQNGNEVVGSETAWAVNGVWLLFVLAFPTFFSVVPLLARGRWWYRVALTCTILMGVFLIISALSFGFYFLPGFAAMLIAVLRHPRRGAAT